MPSPRRSSSRRRSSAAKKIQTRARAKILGQQTRKQHAHSIAQMYRNLANFKITNQCSLCLDSMVNNGYITRLGCSHPFHTKCLRNLVNHAHTTCPMCRAPMTNAAIQSLRPLRQIQGAIAMYGNPNPYLSHLQRMWNAQHRLTGAQQELADFESSGINDPERERILNTRLRFATTEFMEFRQAMRNFTNT
jgi:hypothetical protein